ncbi:MAG: hypothetical protein ACJ77B_12620 [Chloroflexota bacterium]
MKRHRRHGPFLVTAVAAVTLALAACTGPGSSPGASTAPGASAPAASPAASPSAAKGDY